MTFAKRLGVQIATILTQVLVDKTTRPSNIPKACGPLPKSEADRIANERGITFVEDSGKGYRRVVPSPKPTAIIERTAIDLLVKNNILTIALGGGGIPVVRDEDGHLRGVAAVIDKDLTASLIASQINADYLVFLTGVEKVASNFGKSNQKDFDSITVDEAKKYMQDGYFPPGSMGPKVEAALSFVENGGRKSIITKIDKLREALLGRAGTSVIIRGGQNI